MADQYPVTQTRGQPIDGPPRPRRTPEFPEDPDAARAEIEATRARMSETIDEIEDVLLRKKAEVQDRLDVLAPVREDPVRTLAMIFGAALVLGFLTGGGKKHHTVVHYRLPEGMDTHGHEDDAEEEDHEAELAWARAELWEDRAQRLLRIAKAQEEELDLHRSQRETLAQRLRELRNRVADHEEEELEPNLIHRMREVAGSRLSRIASEVSNLAMRGR